MSPNSIQLATLGLVSFIYADRLMNGPPNTPPRLRTASGVVGILLFAVGITEIILAMRA